MKITDIKNNPKKTEIASGFLGGLNTFQDETLIKDNELTEAKNIKLTVDGIEPRDGTVRYLGTSGHKVLGVFPYYLQDGNKKLLRICDGANDKLQYYNGSVVTDIGTKTYDDEAYMNFVQADDKVFTFNGVDSLSYFDGTNITSYTEINAPTGLAVAAQGTTGSTAYSYRVSALNAAGETLASSAVAIANGNATLNATNFNRLTWNTVSGATSYNIYGRKATGKGESFMTTVDVLTFDDKDEDAYEPSLSIFPPESNTTTGVKCSMGIFAISRVFCAGDPNFPSRLYFSGAGERITDFSPSTIGGGAIDVFAKDGYKIRAIAPFQGGVIVFKDNAIYKFSFDSEGFQSLQEITRSFGGISFRSVMAVENDLIFAAKKDGRLAFYSLGNQENYASTVLRTNELSIKVASKLTDVNIDRLHFSASYYFNNVYGCAVSTSGSSVNNRVWKLDTRFGAWTYDEGYTPNQFFTWIDTDGSEKLYFADESSGYVKNMFTADKNDDGVAIDVEWATKSFNQKAFHKYKKYYHPTFQFKNIVKSGALNGYVYLDGAILSSAFTINQQTLGGAGLGAYLFGAVLFGDGGGGTVVTGVSSDVVQQVVMRKNARSIKYVFRSNQLNASYKFLSLAHDFKILDGKPLKSTFRVYPT